MDIKQTYADVQALDSLIYHINKREPEAIGELNRLYRIIYGETVVAGCSNCHIKAFKKLLSLTIKDLETMENQNFKIKKGVLVEYPFRSGQFFSSALGVSDELATEYLTAHPTMIHQFEIYPGSESVSKELDLSLINQNEKGKDLDKMNKTQLQVKYNKVFNAEADDSLNKRQLIDAIESATKKD